VGGKEGAQLNTNTSHHLLCYNFGLLLWNGPIHHQPLLVLVTWATDPIAFSLHCHRSCQCPNPTCFQVKTKMWLIQRLPLFFSLWMTKLLQMESGEWLMLLCACLLVPSSSSVFHYFMAPNRSSTDERRVRDMANGHSFSFSFLYFWTKREHLYSFCLIFSMLINTFLPIALFCCSFVLFDIFTLSSIYLFSSNWLRWEAMTA